MPKPFRVIAWNIRAGGGARIDPISQTISTLAPDVVVLSEFRATPPSVELARRLASGRLRYQSSTSRGIGPSANGLLIASRQPLSARRFRHGPTEPGRFHAVRLTQSSLTVAGMHIPNQHTGRKPQYHEAILRLMQSCRAEVGLFAGDTNSGRSGLDEETAVFNKRTTAWFDQIEALGWRDVFRLLHGNKREFTWYSPGHNNGFRLDQLFVSPRLAETVVAARHLWAKDPTQAHRRDAVSDHAALIVDFDLSRLILNQQPGNG